MNSVNLGDILMIKLRPLQSDDPTLDGSKMLDAFYKTMGYAEEQGGIFELSIHKSQRAALSKGGLCAIVTRTA